MKNILKDKSNIALHGRLLHSTKLLTNYKLEDKKVLDIGCGYGWFEEFAIKKGVSKIVATEITSKDLRTILSNIHNTKVITKVANAIKLPFLSSSFDLVVSWEVLEHIPHDTETKMFSEVYRVLKPGGMFIMSTPYSSWISKITDPAWWLIGHRHYSVPLVSEYAKRAGFKIKIIEVKGRFWEMVGNLNMYLSKWILRRKPLFEQNINYLIDKEYLISSGYMTMFAMFQK